MSQQILQRARSPRTTPRRARFGWRIRRLFFSPEGPRAWATLQSRSSSAIPAFALISYLLALTPTVVMLMGWDGTGPSSFATLIGVFYFIGGMGMTIGAVFEWVVGNTFPFIVFGTFGGFWLSVAVLFDPTMQIASAFPDGTNTPAYNHGIQFYFTFWAVLAALYFVASLRTNVAFAVRPSIHLHV
ncbi:GPR1/FUN34/yaaH family-domain-containing protein [Mycena rosella]|uniref:GPR1/FUN34/yaaH family-domain-containing protein n=1 Tax=Mycena rosella TaxID=1033263 RepID=A0AAD7AX84_MYCRO|nr:GPR1/FUN34/yaaH family-domain-containing protein [Mycena rosella]